VSPSAGFVYVIGWEKFQHPDAVRSGHMPWVKLYTDLVGNDDWLELSPADRTLLNGLWMLTGRYGNGRLRADSGHLNARLKIRKGSLDRLRDAGFIEIRASKSARPDASNRAGLDKDRDVGSIEPTKTKSVASSARRNGAARKHQKHLATAVATAREWKLDDPDHLERDVRETWPDAADFILSRVSAIPAQNGENGSNHEKPATQEPTSAPRADDRDQPVEDIDDMDIPF
jgi:hypothetical protein